MILCVQQLRSWLKLKFSSGKLYIKRWHSPFRSPAFDGRKPFTGITHLWNKKKKKSDNHFKLLQSCCSSLTTQMQIRLLQHFGPLLAHVYFHRTLPVLWHSDHKNTHTLLCTHTHLHISGWQHQATDACEWAPFLGMVPIVAIENQVWQI